MKITAIEVTSFRSGIGLRLPINAPRVLIAGRNGSGKTTVRESLRWALTGRCDQTDGKGAGAEKLIPTASATKAVEAGVEIAGLGTVRRTRQNALTTLKVEGFSGDATAQQSALYDRLGTTQAYLEAVLDTGHFLSLHHADAKALVMGLLDVKVEYQAQSYTLDALDDLYRMIFEQRKVAKIKAREYPVPLPPEGDMPKLDAITELLAKLRVELQERTAAGGDTSGQRKALEKALSDAGTFTPFTDVLSFVEVVNQIGAREAQEVALERELEQAPAPVPIVTPSTPDEQVTIYRTQIEKLRLHKPKGGCVLDPEVPCETSKHKFNYRQKALEDLLAAQGVKSSPVEAPRTPQEAPRTVIELRTELNTVRRELTRLRVLHGKYQQSEILGRAHAARVATLQADLDALPPSGDQDDVIAALQARIGKGEALLGRAQTYWQAVDARAKALVEQQKLTEAARVLETQCEELGPNGLRVEALGKSISTFEERINAGLERFGWTLHFEVDPWQVQVNHRPVETYSESEQFRIGIAVQLAIAEASGLSFAVIDRLDMLDVQARTAMQELIFASPVGQIVVLSTREPGQPLPPPQPALIAYRLQLQGDGITVVAETSIAEAA